ncbi:DNA alkylation repair protein [uncultured Corynebacterium sp.]|uniref:DNA alkylation repair protein n=1 Tax=uncultured Corynebacterium sp. TaxID=159447 RepID=UPI0025D58A49|nr:DNA alkylation repair protein [uncultured Corynebacterium sp.]
MTPAHAFIAAVREGLAPLADPERAAGQAAYLKTDEPMLGVRVPDVRRITRAAADDAGFTSADQVAEAARTLWDGARNREERRAAIVLLRAPVVKRFVGPEMMDLVRHMVITGAWWDLVDDLVRVQLAVRDCDRAGEDARMRAWARDDDMWVRRYAILHQLQAKDATDAGLLADVIEPNLGDGEFFIRKAIGWALRDYSTTDPDWVRAYLDATPELSPLSRREAAKRL